MNIQGLVIEKLATRGVMLDDIVRLVLETQGKYIKSLTNDEVKECLLTVLEKREVQVTTLFAVELDELAEKNAFSPELSKRILSDDGLFGVDEALALSISGLYGTIGLTNFGYLDKLKPGIIKKVDDLGKTTPRCYTFLDDIVGALAACTCAKLAHHHREEIK